MNVIDRKEYNVFDVIENKTFIGMKKKDVEVVVREKYTQLNHIQIFF